MSGTAGPGCGTGEKGLVAHRDQIQAAMTLDGKPLEFTTATVAMRNGSYDTDDAIPGYVGLTKDEVAVNEDRGGKLVLAAKGMTLTGLTVGTRAVDERRLLAGAANDDGDTEGPHLAARDAWPDRRSSAPTRRGDVHARHDGNWQTECLQGDGTALRADPRSARIPAP